MTKRNFELARQMGDYNVIQRTCDGMFDANALLRQWNGNNPSKQKQMSKFLESKKTKDFITTISKREHYLEIAESDISKNTVVYVQKGRRARGVH